SLEMIIS
ncbi:hypothetical protein D030_3768B, partial [Vibrio parahaemolyticus AQ3810]